eukprot:scaffold130378_cov22-Tisochrysis_lutea.AAC.1
MSRVCSNRTAAAEMRLSEETPLCTWFICCQNAKLGPTRLLDMHDTTKHAGARQGAPADCAATLDACPSQGAADSTALFLWPILH